MAVSSTVATLVVVMSGLGVRERREGRGERIECSRVAVILDLVRAEDRGRDFERERDR